MSELVTSWFNLHPDIKFVNWPANSGDIHPLSRVWNDMLSYVDDNYPLTRDEIKYLVRTYWVGGTYFVNFDRLFNIIRDSLRMVIVKEGGSLH